MSTTVKHYSYQYQDVWQERAKDERLELVWRVAALAFGHHRRNGHATFEPGRIATELGISTTQVSNVIAKAKELGLIDGRSGARCLVVPPHAVSHGPGEPTEPCGYCEGKRTGRRTPQNRRLSIARPSTPAVAELAAEAIAAGNVVPFKPSPEPECVGCKMFTRDACNIHSEHWQKLREPVPA